VASIPDWGVFLDAKGRRCVAYNGGCEYCLDVAEDGSQTFTLGASGERCVKLDTQPDGKAMPKVRNMAVPFNRNAGSPDRLPVGVPVFFEGRVTIAPNFQRISAWWFLLAQFQRITNPTSPPASLHIESVKTAYGYMEYLRGNVAHLGAPGGMMLGERRFPVPRGLDFKYRLDFRDAAGGPDGFLKIVVTPDGKPPQTICDYQGVTGFPDNEGLYAGWGIYGADRSSPKQPAVWSPKQLPLVMRFTDLDWGQA